MFDVEDLNHNFVFIVSLRMANQKTVSFWSDQSGESVGWSELN